MNIARRNALALIAVALTGGPTLAQDYPNRVVRIVVPQLSGGPSDGLPRYIAVAQAGVSDAVVDRLNRQISQITDTPQYRARLAFWGMTPAGSTPGEIVQFLAAERSRWQRAVPESGAKLE